MTKSLERLASGISRYGITKILIHREGKDPLPSTALKDGVKAVPMSRLGSIIGGKR